VIAPAEIKAGPGKDRGWAVIALAEIKVEL
jgi:hypothetical protein